MCSTPSMPTPVAAPTVQQEVAAPTYADASVSKATTATRNKAAALAGRDIKTTARGLSDEASMKRKIF